MKKKEMQKRARKAAARYLESKGYDVLDRDHMGFIVARDGDALVFAKLVVNVGAFPNDPVERHEFEEAMMMWLLSHDEGDVPVRRDEIAMAVVGEHKAGLRHSMFCC